MESNELYSALGLEVPADEKSEDTGSENVDTESGENKNEGEDKSAVEAKETDKGGKEERVADAQSGSSEAENGKDGRDRERDAAFAAARRRAEADYEKKLEAQREESESKINEILSSLHIEDPYTGKQISSVKEYEDYKNKVSEEEVASQLETSGLTRETIDKLISEHPAVKRAEEITAKLGEEEYRHQEEAIQKSIEADIKAIGELDPEIKSLEDLANVDKDGEILGLVKKGYSLKDAYMVINFDKISARQDAAARQRALNDINSKGHLNKSTGAGKAAMVDVPSDVKEQYRFINPGMSDEEITRDYNRYLKSRN